MHGAGTEIRNLEGTTHDYSGLLKRSKAGSWIRMLAKEHPEMDRHDIGQCACYTAGTCRLTKGTLFGAHVKLYAGSGVYIIPLCAAHNGKRSTGLKMLATREFPAVKLDGGDGDKELVAARALTHLAAARSDMEELLGEGVLLEEITQLERRLAELVV